MFKSIFRPDWSPEQPDESSLSSLFCRYTSGRFPMHHQRKWASSLAVIPQTLSLPPAQFDIYWFFPAWQLAGFTHTHTQARTRTHTHTSFIRMTTNNHISTMLQILCFKCRKHCGKFCAHLKHHPHEHHWKQTSAQPTCLNRCLSTAYAICCSRAQQSYKHHYNLHDVKKRNTGNGFNRVIQKSASVLSRPVCVDRSVEAEHSEIWRTKLSETWQLAQR